MTMGTHEALPPNGGTKAFKGKGDVRRRMREVEQQLTVLHHLMRQLKDQTRAVRGRVFALEVDERPRREWVLLRWRYLLGQHALWARDIGPSLVAFPEGLQTWYRHVNMTASILNAQERCLRYERL